MVRMVNTRDAAIVTADFGGLSVPPGGECDIEDGYCNARLSLNGSRIPSLVEQLAKGLVPRDEKLRATWGQHLRITALPVEVEVAGLPPAAISMIQNGVIDAPKRRRKGG